MLLQFSVTNYRSIKETAIISMKASGDKTMETSLIYPDSQKPLVPVTAIYGANAAGKSNVIYALLLMKDMVCGNYAKLLKGENLPYEPFAFMENQTEPTTFEIIYYYEGIKYAYGFSYNDEKIVSEYLYHWPNGREALVFSRENDIYEFRENQQEQRTLASRTSGNKLYLTCSNEWNCSQTEKAYLWFRNKLCDVTETTVSFESTINAIRSGNEAKSQILKEMMLADLGISDIEILENNNKTTVKTIHQISDSNGNVKQYELLLGQESMGTQRFFSRIGLWLNAMNSGSVLVVDEIETSLHPMLTRHLIEMIQDRSINKNHAQLIFTTHDVGLLDLKLLRRDQIWFVEKDNQNMQTEVYALTEFSPRKEENIAKGYMQGRYGAVPFIGGGL